MVLAMWDQEFLYLAVNCAKAPGLNYAPDASQRPRDSDLSGHDQLQIHLPLGVALFGLYLAMAVALTDPTKEK